MARWVAGGAGRAGRSTPAGAACCATDGLRRRICLTDVGSCLAALHKLTCHRHAGLRLRLTLHVWWLCVGVGADLYCYWWVLCVLVSACCVMCCVTCCVTCCVMCCVQTHPVVGAYMEFVERKPLPQHAHLAASGQLREVHRRDGFESDSARNIFASTTEAAVAAQKAGLL